MNCADSIEWRGLYRKDYDLQVVESTAHPAKAAWGLAFKIIEHLEELELLKPGDRVLDPMMGTGRFCLAACAKGYAAIGLELESRFVGFCRDNLAYASRKLNRQLDWTILQGDARKLSEILQERGLVTVTSPPYFDSDNKGARAMPDGYWNQVGGVGHLREVDYGSTPGQIGNLKDRPLKAVMSPPYADINSDNRQTLNDTCLRNNRLKSIGTVYGQTEGNIGNLPDRPLKCVTSPPYEDAKIRTMRPGTVGEHWKNEGFAAHDNPAGYGQSEGQIGRTGENDNPESYLEAMRQVYAEIGKVADVLAVVTKNITRAGKLRRLDLDTIALLEATGWCIHCLHKAILFEEQETATLFGDSHKKPKGRLSFFKRLSYQKGSPVASHEDILIAVRA